jgi:hypothetical protein
VRVRIGKIETYHVITCMVSVGAASKAGGVDEEEEARSPGIDEGEEELGRIQAGCIDACV